MSLCQCIESPMPVKKDLHRFNACTLYEITSLACVVFVIKSGGKIFAVVLKFFILKKCALHIIL